MNKLEGNNEMEEEQLNRVMKNSGSTLYTNPAFYLTYLAT